MKQYQKFAMFNGMQDATKFKIANPNTRVAALRVLTSIHADAPMGTYIEINTDSYIEWDSVVTLLSEGMEIKDNRPIEILTKEEWAELIKEIK